MYITAAKKLYLSGKQRDMFSISHHLVLEQQVDITKAKIGEERTDIAGRTDSVQKHFRISELCKILWLKFSEDMHLNFSSQSSFIHLSLICFSKVSSAKTENKHMVKMSKNIFTDFLSTTRLSEINVSLNLLTEGICHITQR